MSSLGNKEIMAKNLRYYVERSGKTQKEICEIIGVSTSTFNDWMRAKNYPRIDKIELLARLFHIMKSDLIEDKPQDHKEMQKKNDILSDIVLKLNEDMELLSMVETLSQLGFEQRQAVKTVLNAFSKAEK
jgi:transcriptional regulator with XRE-family HTH domain